MALAVSAHCPGVVVHGESGLPGLPGPGRPVVVGVDGSMSSQEAVRRGADVAASAYAEPMIMSLYRTPACGARAEAVPEGFYATRTDGAAHAYVGVHASDRRE